MNKLIHKDYYMLLNNLGIEVKDFYIFKQIENLEYAGDLKIASFEESPYIEKGWIYVYFKTDRTKCLVIDERNQECFLCSLILKEYGAPDFMIDKNITKQFESWLENYCKRAYVSYKEYPLKSQLRKLDRREDNINTERRAIKDALNSICAKYNTGKSIN